LSDGIEAHVIGRRALTIAIIGAMTSLLSPGLAPSASAALPLGPALRLTPSVGPPGTAVSTDGRGFAAAETVDIFFQGIEEVSVTTDGTGRFLGAVFDIPVGSGPPWHGEGQAVIRERVSWDPQVPQTLASPSKPRHSVSWEKGGLGVSGAAPGAEAFGNRGVLLGPGRRRSRSYPPGRICEMEGCGTWPSIYNGSESCWVPASVAIPSHRVNRAPKKAA
jgi:hypothetical protein